MLLECLPLRDIPDMSEKGENCGQTQNTLEELQYMHIMSGL